MPIAFWHNPAQDGRYNVYFCHQRFMQIVFEIRRRHYHLGNVALIAYSEQPYMGDNMSPQAMQVADMLIKWVPDY